jgi:hypothetical protein
MTAISTRCCRSAGRASVAALLLIGCAAAAAARPPSLEGQWRLNLKESELIAGEDALTSLVMAITEDDAQGFRWTVTVRTQAGEAGSTGFAGAIDGKLHPIIGRPGSASAFSWTADGALKQVSESPGGLAVEICSLSPKLDRMTCEARQTDRTGRTQTYVEVFDRG